MSITLSVRVSVRLSICLWIRYILSLLHNSRTDGPSHFMLASKLLGFDQHPVAHVERWTCSCTFVFEQLSVAYVHDVSGLFGRPIPMFFTLYFLIIMHILAARCSRIHRAHLRTIFPVSRFSLIYLFFIYTLFILFPLFHHQVFPQSPCPRVSPATVYPSAFNSSVALFKNSNYWVRPSGSNNKPSFLMDSGR